MEFKKPRVFFFPCRHWLGSSVFQHRTMAEALQVTPGHPGGEVRGEGASPGREGAFGWHSPPLTPALRDPDTVLSSASPRGTLLVTSPLNPPSFVTPFKICLWVVGGGWP